MKHPLALLISMLLSLTACAPAATPATTSAPPAFQPTTAPAAPAPAQPAATPNATVGSTDLRPPISGGLTNPPTIAPKQSNTQPNSTNRVKGWQQLGSSIVPPARYDHALVFAGDFNRLVLFGGRSAATLNDTWIYDLSANAWHAVTGSIAPDARYGAGAAYDFNRKQVVLFGGQSAAKFFNDVWIFNVVTEKWSKLTTIGTAPTARSSMAVAIDLPFDQLIISHGATAQGRADDTWSLALASKVWQSLAPIARPEARSQSGAVFDGNHHRLIVFGGLNTTGIALNDQWSLDPLAQVWRQFGTITPSNPAARSGSTLVYDPITFNIYLFGGKTIGGLSKEVWSLDPNNNWLSIGFGSGPSARSDHAAAWDSINNRMIVYGGLDANNKPLNDLWAFTP